MTYAEQSFCDSYPINGGTFQSYRSVDCDNLSVFVASRLLFVVMLCSLVDLISHLLLHAYTCLSVLISTLWRDFIFELLFFVILAVE